MVARRYTSKVRGLAIAEKSIFSEEVACPTGIEPVTYSLEGCCSIQLSYGQKARAGTSPETN